MSQNEKHKWKDVSLRVLEEILTSLPEISVPETLEQKLLAGVGGANGNPMPARRTRWYHPAGGFGLTAAAAVLIFAVMPIVNHDLSAPSSTFLMEFDSTLLWSAASEGDVTYDQNAFAGFPSGLDLIFRVVNQNEP